MENINKINRKIFFTLATILIFLFSQPISAQWGHNKEWMGLIRQNCSPTLKGSAKELIGEKSFWVEVSVSMDMWIEDMRLSRYDEFCRASYPNPSQKEKLMSCIASVKHDFDWYNRCKNQVVYKCRTAGGFCN
jgi:hypothetical protein